MLIKYFSMLDANQHSKHHVRLLVEAVHFGLKSVSYSWDVWLNPKVMDTLLAWRCSLSASAWSRTGDVAMELTGARKINPDRVQLWQIPTRGYLSNFPHRMSRSK